MDGTLPAGARHDLTDEQWLILAALLPGRSRTGRPRRWTLRQLINGIRFRIRTGCPWRDVPERYGTWQCVYGLFRAWQLAGRWAGIETALQAVADEVGLIDWTVSGSLVQVNGRQRSFQASMNRSMAAIRSATVGKLPRRSAWRVMIEKNASTRFSHDPEVGVKCSRTRGWRSSQARTTGCLWVA